MHAALLTLIGPGGFGLAFGGAYLYNHFRHRPIGERADVWNRHTYRLACRQVERQAAAELWFAAWEGATAICAWLGSERHYGSARRQAWFNRQFAAWTMKCGEFNPLANATANTGR